VSPNGCSSNRGGLGGNPQPAFLWRTNEDNGLELLRLVAQALTVLGLAVPCHYAGQRNKRPGCEVIASVRYGPIALCGNCDGRRSLVGEGLVGVKLAGPGALLRILEAARGLNRALEAERTKGPGHRADQPAAQLRTPAGGRASRITSKAGPRAGSSNRLGPRQTGCLYNEVPPPALPSRTGLTL
jgi:hypothetical protein